MQKLAAARAAFAARHWTGAHDGFLAARQEAPLDADDLSALAGASWWLGLMDESLVVGEEAYGRYLEASDHRRAAMRAFDIAYAYFLRGNEEVGGGWVSRAQRLLADEPDCPEQGYLLYFAVETSLDGGEETMAKARQVQDFGRRHADRNLVAAGIVAEGRVLIKLGRVQEGLALLDEGMLEASAEDMSPIWAGNIYCHLMAACYELGDIRRAAAWTQSTAEWCDRMAPAVLFKGICQVHRARSCRSAVRGRKPRTKRSGCARTSPTSTSASSPKAATRSARSGGCGAISRERRTPTARVTIWAATPNPGSPSSGWPRAARRRPRR